MCRLSCRPCGGGAGAGGVGRGAMAGCRRPTPCTTTRGGTAGNRAGHLSVALRHLSRRLQPRWSLGACLGHGRAAQRARRPAQLPPPPPRPAAPFAPPSAAQLIYLAAYWRVLLRAQRLVAVVGEGPRSELQIGQGPPSGRRTRTDPPHAPSHKPKKAHGDGAPSWRAGLPPVPSSPPFYSALFQTPNPLVVLGVSSFAGAHKPATTASRSSGTVRCVQRHLGLSFRVLMQLAGRGAVCSADWRRCRGSWARPVRVAAPGAGRAAGWL
jgi:hypothetical protein